MILGNYIVNFFIILFLLIGFGVSVFTSSPIHAESNETVQNHPLEKQIRFSGIYTQDGTETSVLQTGQQAHIAFSTLSIKNPEGVQIKIGYQVVTDKDFPRYDDEMAEFTSDSINISRPVSLPYVPDKAGEHFLRLNMSYDDPLNNSSGHQGGSQNSFQVVEKYGKAVYENNGKCKKSGFIAYVKSDYSTIVCVSLDTMRELIIRGY